MSPRGKKKKKEKLTRCIVHPLEMGGATGVEYQNMGRVFGKKKRQGGRSTQLDTSSSRA